MIHTLELFGVYLGTRLGLYDALDRPGRSRPASWPSGPASPRATPASGSSSRRSPGVLARRRRRPADRPRPAAIALPAAHGGVARRPRSTPTTWPRSRAMVVGIGRCSTMSSTPTAPAAACPSPATARTSAAARAASTGRRSPPTWSKTWLPAVPDVAERLARRRPGRRPGLRAAAGRPSPCRRRGRWRRVIGRRHRRRLDRRGPRRTPRGRASTSASSRGADGRRRLSGHGPLDVVLVLEALHDMRGPVGRAGRRPRRPRAGRLVVVADEAVAEAFVAPGDDVERMMYGWSVVHCLPAAMAEQPSAAIGTVDPSRDRAALRPRGRLRALRGAGDRQPAVPFLPDALDSRPPGRPSSRREQRSTP